MAAVALCLVEVSANVLMSGPAVLASGCGGRRAEPAACGGHHQLAAQRRARPARQAVGGSQLWAVVRLGPQGVPIILSLHTDACILCSASVL